MAVGQCETVGTPDRSVGGEPPTFWSVARHSTYTKTPASRKKPGIIISTPERTRTPNLLVRSQTLCPVELRALKMPLHKQNSPAEFITKGSLRDGLRG